VAESPGEKEGGINWFKGSLEEAFASAKNLQKPIFLYWGAVWCPPCQEIKNTVFKSSQFIAQSNLFIPVYLDGDTEQAQSWGEHFGVQGYPTMIVFNHDGEEITRIPGGIDVSRYAGVLELSLNHMRPTAMLVNLAIKEPEKLQNSDFTQLAYYSWQQDHKSLPEDQGSDLFYKISGLAIEQNPEASARLFLHYLSTLADERLEWQDETAKDQSENKAADLPEPAGESLGRIQQILASDELVLACWDYLNYNADTLVQLVTAEGTQRVNLMASWQSRVLALHKHPSLSTAEQLGAWVPTLEFFALTNPDGQLDAETLSALLADVNAADKITKSPYTRQSVINQASHLLQDAKQTEAAEKLLTAELEKSKSPYYFMSSLASLAEDQDKVDEAIAWRKKAYDSSTGSATRLQWGAAYVRSLIRLKPEDSKLIVDTAMGLFENLQSDREAFAGRNFRVFRSLNEKLREWESSQESSTYLASFHSRLAVLCETQVPDSLEATNCQQLLQASPG
jgi:thioredoxin-like negative regulator of GroEL